MNTEIIRGNALQVIKLVENVEALEREKTENLKTAQYYSDKKDKRITELEKEKEELSKRCERLREDFANICNASKFVVQQKDKEIEELQQKKQRIIEGAKKTQEEEMFMTQKYIEASKEVTRLKGLLARNGIKYKKVK